MVKDKTRVKRREKKNCLHYLGANLKEREVVERPTFSKELISVKWTLSLQVKKSSEND